MFMESKVSMEEVESHLKSFRKEKCLIPDGWSVELFLFFLDGK